MRLKEEGKFLQYSQITFLLLNNMTFSLKSASQAAAALGSEKRRVPK